jgi:hypothetical protein
MQEKNKLYMYTSQNHQVPLKPSHMDDKHQFPSANQQIKKNQGVW